MCEHTGRIFAEIEALPFLDDCGSLGDLKLNN